MPLILEVLIEPDEVNYNFWAPCPTLLFDVFVFICRLTGGLYGFIYSLWGFESLLKFAAVVLYGSRGCV